MLTKCSIAQKVADEGITVIIANGKKDNILVDLLAKDSQGPFARVSSRQTNLSAA